MERVIHKAVFYEDPSGLLAVVKGGSARFLAVGWQGNNLCVWYETHPSSSWRSERQDVLRAVMTGQNVPERGEYVGTAMRTTDQPVMPFFVVHVYKVDR